MVLDKRLKAIVKSPDMPQLMEHLSQIWADEQRRRQEFYDWVTPHMKAEYIEGEVIVHSPVRKKHNVITGAVYFILQTWSLRNQMGFVGFEKIMLRFRRNDYEPDVVYFGPEKADTLQDDQTLFPAPDLIVEVLSPSTEARDRGVKFQDYALHGVLEYWIIDPETETLEQYLLTGSTYVLQPQQEILESKAMPGFQVPVRAFFDREVQVRVM